MKVLLFTLTLLISNLPLSYAQHNALKSNQFIAYTVQEDEIVKIQWESDIEVNSSYYLIEKSIDGKKFQTISLQKAGSSTFQKTNYTFEDVEENASRVKYRITLVLMDGTAISTTTINEFNTNLTEDLRK